MAPFRNNTQGPINHPLSDLLTQTILLTTRNGTEIPISLQDLSNIQYLAITWSACFAIQIGAATILFCLLPLLSNPSRRRSLPFLCNMITLAIVILRGILHIYYYFSPFTTPYRLFTEEYIGIPMSARIISIASAITTLLLKAMVQFSLIIQLRILFQNREGIKNALTIGTSLLAAVSTGIYVWIVVLSTEVILQEPVGHSSPNSRLTFASKVTFAGSITVFSALLVGKLLVAIKERRALGLKKFGVFKIALVLGLQTMFIPAIFTIVDSFVDLDGLISFTPALAGMFLPLASMWASAKHDSPDTRSAVGLGKVSYESDRSSRGSHGSDRSDEESLPRTAVSPWSPTAIVNSMRPGFLLGRKGSRASSVNEKEEKEKMEV
ncbi:fungal pheromone mating factor STE2 GPCR-domain-containing protein [Pyronema domesticum]|nr:fungal pheromone mating factor STE2 GPCR-domain-containing protein [Pyronema domesticum]